MTLFSRRRQNGYGTALTLIAALILGQIVYDMLKSLSLIAAIPAGILLVIFLFWQTGKLEAQRDVI